jgi:molybdate transport system ATP-binding protein
MKTDKRPFLTLSRASFRLGDRLVFEDSSWVFQKTEQWAVVGANGSGKSLLGDALRGRVPLVKGELTYHFHTPAGMTAEECIGHLSFEERKANVRDTVVQSRWNSADQESGLSVQEFLAYERVMEINPFEVNAADAGRRDAFERRKRRAIRLLRVQPFLERQLLTLSNGETQRVQWARELCRPLRLLILDEPFTGLDAENRKYFRDVMDRLMRSSLRLLIITARPEDLPAGITHVLEMDECRIVKAESRSQFKPRSSRRMEALIFSRRTHHPSRPDQSLSCRVGSAATRKGKELIRMRNVTVAYGDRTIIEQINWTVREGESWALLGPNGSGKTTLLSLVLGDNPQAYRNEVFVFGKRRGTGESIWEIKKHIGWVSPELQIHFDDATTCLEVVESGFRDTVGVFEAPTSRQKRAAREWLARFGLLKMANEPLFALSAGLRRMVLLARALVKRPRLLVLDEPCQGLDAEHRELFVQTLDELLHDRRETAIYVTHRVEEIPRSIKRILKLRAA